MTRQVGEPIAVGVSEDLLQRVLRLAVREQVEDTEALVGVGRRVEPRDERAAARLRLPDAEAEPILEAAVVLAVPDGPEVIREVTREEELVGRREAGHRTRIRLGDQEAMPDLERAIRGVRIRLTPPELAVGIHPGEIRLARIRERQAGVVQDRPPIFAGPDDTLHMDQSGTVVDRDVELSGEWPDREVADGDGRAVALTGHADSLQIELRPVRLKRPFGGRIEEDIEGAHPRRPASRGFSAADQQERHRVRGLEGD